MAKIKKIKLLAIVLFILGSAHSLFAQTCTQPSGSSNTPAWINVQKDCGAKGDGVTDDSTAFQNAFQALGSGGGTIYCPTGKYLINTGINISGKDGIRFIGDSAANVNSSGVKGCTLVAKTNSITVLTLDGTGASDKSNGPVIEWVNFVDSTPTGYTATLLKIANFNNWTARNVGVSFANIGLLVDGLASDASWGYVPQLLCFNSNVCLDSERGGFVAIGGHYQPKQTGIIAKWPQARIIGVKVDCNNLQTNTGIDLMGSGDIVQSSQFEGECLNNVHIHNAVGTTSQNTSGSENIVVGNHFNGWGLTNSLGVHIGGPNSGQSDYATHGNVVVGNAFDVNGGGYGIQIESTGTGTQISGNTYSSSTGAPSTTTVNDLGTGTTRYELGLSGLSGAGAPSGSCNTGALYSNTTSSPNTLYVCVSSTWQAVK